MEVTDNGNTTLTAKDFATDQDVRWCPGCGDYSILKQVQTVLADTVLQREDVVFVSGIGCAARFPYYMNTYGMHSIHGRAPAVASGLKSVNPNLSIWVATGDGDSLSIGGNHLIHTLRRNFDLNILLFNNEIYGLTKGQYSPTSPKGMMTKSTPLGSIDHPFDPLKLAFGADGSFIARTMDRDVKHLREVVTKANDHKGTSLVEIYQNCNVFNDGAFFTFTDKATKKDNCIFLQQDEPLVFGEEDQYGVKLDGFKPMIVNLQDGTSLDELWIHDEQDKAKAALLTQYFDSSHREEKLPKPFGIIYREERSTYEDNFLDQLQSSKEKKGPGNLDELLEGKNTWVVN
ncbi:MAG: 2-oxoacid:ferredoxin oxidoreductase subunit beta [Cyclobacteriaceae bacterium]